MLSATSRFRIDARGGDFAALLCGALLPFAFAPFGWFPLAVIGFALLLRLWRDATPRRALWRGWLFGLSMFGIGISWVYVSIHDFGNAQPVVGVAAVTGLVMFLSVYPGLAGYLAVRCGAGRRLWFALGAAPAAWVMTEWLRGWVLTGFPWLAVGYSQIDGPLAGVAPIVGVYGVGWITIVGGGALLAVLQASGRQRWAVFAAAAGLILAAQLLRAVEWTAPRGDPVSVALVQGNIPQDLKWQLEQRESTLSLYMKLTEDYWGRDLVIWPETAVPAFYHQVKDDFLFELERTARRQSTDMLLGVPVLDLEAWSYYNGVVAVGQTRGMYYKRHLVPFGEYMPLRAQIGFFLDQVIQPMADFSAGGFDQPLLQAAGYPVSASVCFEAAFGEEIIRTLPEAAVLVNVSNDAWFGDSLAPHQHLEISRMRALETGRWLLRATNTGISAIVDAQGRLSVRGPQFETTVIEGEFIPMRGATPYVRVGNYPVVIAVTLLVIIGLWRGRAGFAGLVNN